MGRLVTPPCAVENLEVHAEGQENDVSAVPDQNRCIHASSTPGCPQDSRMFNLTVPKDSHISVFEVYLLYRQKTRPSDSNTLGLWSSHGMNAQSEERPQHLVTDIILRDHDSIRVPAPSL